MSDGAHVAVLARDISPAQHNSSHTYTLTKNVKVTNNQNTLINNYWVPLTNPSNPQIPGCYCFPLAEPPPPFPCWSTPSSLPFTSPLAVLHLCQNSMGCFRVVETAAWQWNWYPSPSSSQAMCRHSGTYQCDWWAGWTAGGTPTLIKSKHPQQIGQWWTNKSTTPQRSVKKKSWKNSFTSYSRRENTCTIRQNMKVKHHCSDENNKQNTILNQWLRPLLNNNHWNEDKVIVRSFGIMIFSLSVQLKYWDWTSFLPFNEFLLFKQFPLLCCIRRVIYIYIFFRI